MEGSLKTLRSHFQKRSVQAIEVQDLRLLEKVEKEHPASQDCIGEFKFASNEEMLDYIHKRRGVTRAPVAP